MNQNAFLYQVAKQYIDNESNNLSKYCFVFPNKRSGVFFSDYFEKIASESKIMPNITTISDFISDHSSYIEASRHELLFLLYQCYVEILNNGNVQETEIPDFDRFMYWGDMILNDFNDVDRYCVDARELFTNVSNLKELNSNYLTKEQREVLSHYFAHVPEPYEPEQFWAHINNSDTTNNHTHKFKKIWTVLYELYCKFNERLKLEGLCYSGMNYKTVALNIKNSQIDFNFTRYIFVGFNVLSTTEMLIFKSLHNLGLADFYWDYNEHTFGPTDNNAHFFVKQYCKLYKSIYKLDISPIEQNLNIIGIPSTIGQIKEAGNIVSTLAKQGLLSPDNALNTAIVLPDESQFVYLTHSIPDIITEVNITMGYPLRYATMSAIIKSIVSMQLRARQLKGNTTFFHEDITQLISIPLIKFYFPEECNNINTLIENEHLFNIESNMLCEQFPNLKYLFTPISDICDIDNVCSYFDNLFAFFEKLFNEKSLTDRLNLQFIAYYRYSLKIVKSMIDKYGITMRQKTFLHLVERTLISQTINFNGEPLKGLQIMGMLETRALDFENVIIVSLNERIYPGKHYSKTFIPQALRHGYGMSTIKHQECMLAYYFYRLISRAKNVYLLYDARGKHSRNGAQSTYLKQLCLLDNKAKHKYISYNVFLNHEDENIIVKDDNIMKKIECYRQKRNNINIEDPNAKFLSASSINSYIKCPMSFYLEYIEGIKIKDEVVDYIDDSQYGTIIHYIAELIYSKLLGYDQSISNDDLTKLANGTRDKELRNIITISINKHYNKIGDDNITPLIGEMKVLGEVILFQLHNFFKEEKKFTPFKYIAGEKNIKNTYDIGDPEYVYNLKAVIDRIDETNDYIRIVDYKTGTETVEIKNLSELFESSSKDKLHAKAILQLFMYSDFYRQQYVCKKEIQPLIYLLKKMSIDGLNLLKIKDAPIYSISPYIDEFRKLLKEKVIDPLFDINTPFVASKNPKSCTFCKFTEFCRK